jgi:hypothetical protein
MLAYPTWQPHRPRTQGHNQTTSFPASNKPQNLHPHLMGLNLATFELRSSFGQTRAYPVSPEAHALCALCQTKTLPHWAVEQAKILGVSLLSQHTGQPITREQLL